MRQSRIAILLAAASVHALPTGQDTESAWVIGQPVKTSSGDVIGHEAAWPANAGVSAYLGIPFGQPPVGDLRFEKPVAFKGNGTITASKFVS
jgi:Carboxylesterase family